MSSCHDMKKGEVYTCGECGLEVQVVAECRDVGKPASECGCHGAEEEMCEISCCGKPLAKRE